MEVVIHLMLRFEHILDIAARCIFEHVVWLLVEMMWLILWMMRMMATQIVRLYLIILIDSALRL